MVLENTTLNLQYFQIDLWKMTSQYLKVNDGTTQMVVLLFIGFTDAISINVTYNSREEFNWHDCPYLCGYLFIYP